MTNSRVINVCNNYVQGLTEINRKKTQNNNNNKNYLTNHKHRTIKDLERKEYGGSVAEAHRVGETEST